MDTAKITAVPILLLLCAAPRSVVVAQPLERLITAAKQESELYFVAGPSTFGGKKGLAALNPER
jgi:hypothetical protein